MEALFEHSIVMNLGVLGSREVYFDYQIDDDMRPEIVSAWLMKLDGSLDIEITDYLTGAGMDELYAAAEEDAPGRLIDAAEYAMEYR